MLSRTAEHLYWLARYMERADDMARIVLAGHWMASKRRAVPAGSGIRYPKKADAA